MKKSRWSARDLAQWQTFRLWFKSITPGRQRTVIEGLVSEHAYYRNQTAASATATPRHRVVIVDGVRFVSKRPGSYYSECGRWAIFHMMEGTVGQQWELYAIDEAGDTIDLIDWGLALGDIVAHARRGVFTLQAKS